MITVIVNTLWQGKVGVRDRYVKEAIDRREGLLIKHGNESMALPLTLLKEKIAGKSDKRMENYFGKDRHYLIYFFWVPTTKQESFREDVLDH